MKHLKKLNGRNNVKDAPCFKKNTAQIHTARWDLICREAYQDRMEEGIGEKVIEYWDNHYCAIPDRKHVLRQCSCRGIYKEHCKHVMEMTGVALFEEFKESNPGV